MSESTAVVELEAASIYREQIVKSEMGSAALDFKKNSFNFSRITFISPCARISK